MGKSKRCKQDNQAISTGLLENSQREANKETLLDFILRAGIEVLNEEIEAEIASLCGDRYKHLTVRECTRWSKTNSELILGGRRITVTHNRVRNVKKGSEQAISSISMYKDQDPLTERQMESMTIGVSTRKYKRSIEGKLQIGSHGESKSAVSRNFVARTTAHLKTWLNSPIREKYPVLMIDGIVAKKTTVIIALGIKDSGVKTVLGLREGSTENSRLCIDLLQDLIGRGFKPEELKLSVIDGGKGIRKALDDVFGKELLIQRCQLHKKRNVEDYLPLEKRQAIRMAMNEAYQAPSYDGAKRLLLNLKRKLENEYPQAASSLEEGFEETLTLLKIKAPKEIQKSLATTNPIENLMSGIRETTRRVKRWKNSQMVVRWIYTGIMESQRNFNKIKGHQHMKHLLSNIDVYHDKSLEQNEHIA